MPPLSASHTTVAGACDVVSTGGVMILFVLSPHAVSAATTAMPPHACIRLDRDNNNDMDNLDRQMVAVVRHASPDKTIDSRARDVPIVDATTKCSLALAGCALAGARCWALADARC